MKKWEIMETDIYLNDDDRPHWIVPLRFEALDGLAAMKLLRSSLALLEQGKRWTTGTSRPEVGVYCVMGAVELCNETSPNPCANTLVEIVMNSLSISRGYRSAQDLNDRGGSFSEVQSLLLAACDWLADYEWPYCLNVSFGVGSRKAIP